MAHTTSKMPPRSSTVTGSRQGGTPQPSAGASKGTAETGVGTRADQYQAQHLHSIMRDMKAQVTKQTDRPFNPSSLVRGETTAPRVKTEELRAEARQAAQAGKKSELSEFEKIFLEFFSGSRTLGILLKGAEKKFRQKKLEEWREFFEDFFAYSQKKQAHRDKIRRLIYRGLTKGEPRPEAGDEEALPAVIVDLHLKRPHRDREEKFVRISLPDTELHGTLQERKPGQEIPTEIIQKLIRDDELTYWALSYKPVRRGFHSARGSALAAGLERQAQAAARAREAMSNRSMGISSRSASLAAEQMKKKK